MKKTYEVIEYIKPLKVIDSHLLSNKNALLKCKNLINSFEIEGCAILKKSGYLILDFGKEYSGGLRLILSYYQNEKAYFGNLRIRLGESLGEVYQDIGENYSSNDHSPRDFVVNVPRLSDLTLGESGFRFARIDNLTNSDISFRAILLAYNHINLTPKAYFKSDDELVNKIFDVANRTSYMCTQKGFLVEGIKRDRLVWAGDLYVQIKTNLDTIGCYDAITDTLDSLMKTNSIGKWMNSIPTYSLWYILNVYEVFKHTYNHKWLSKHLDYIKNIIFQIEKCILEDGNIDFQKICPVDNRLINFIDWSSVSDANSYNAVRSFTKYTLEKAKELFEDNSFIDVVLVKLKVGKIDNNAYKGVRAIYELACNDNPKLLTQNGLDTMSTFLTYPIYHVMANNNYVKEALDNMRSYYGKMLDLNASTFFEAYKENWIGGKIDEYDSTKPYFHQNYGDFSHKGYRLSLCHAWASGPVPFLLEDVAGIKAIDSTTYSIKSNVGDLKMVEAAIMTSKGLLEVKIQNQNGKVSYSYKAPKGITIK